MGGQGISEAEWDSVWESFDRTLEKKNKEAEEEKIKLRQL